MKIFDKIAKRLASKTSAAVKSEVKRTIVDFVPTIFAIASAIAGVVIFKGVVEPPKPSQPNISSTTINTRNYFFREMSDEAIKKILDE